MELCLDGLPDRTKQKVRNALTYAKALDLTNSITEVTTERKPSLFGRPIASYDPNEKRLYINPQECRETVLQYLNQTDEIVGGTIMTIILHECFHAEHMAKFTDEEIQFLCTINLTHKERTYLENSVSKRSSYHGLEAVAELAVLKLQGNTLSPELNQIYTKFCGPQVPYDHPHNPYKST